MDLKGIPMKKYNILVTGVGAIIGYGIIKSIRKSKYDCNIIGMDIYEDAVGQAWTDQFETAVLAYDGAYIPFLKGLIAKYKIDLIFFGTEQELEVVSKCKDESVKGKCVLNSEAAFKVSEDKWLTYMFLVENGLRAIPSSREHDYELIGRELGVPFLLKPRRSYAGKGIKKISNKRELDFYSEYVSEDNYMVQKIIGDDFQEYTAAVFGYGDGTCSETIIFKRKLSQEGATAKAYVEDVPEIKTIIHRICGLIKPVGPTNFQFRRDNDEYYLLEVNPRISSSTSIRTAFGFNEAEMCIEWFLENKKPEEKRAFKNGMAIRYIDEWVTE